MDAFLEYIEKYKFALIGTVIVHVFAFFYFNFKTLEQPFRMPPPEVEGDILIEEIDFDPEIIEQMQLNNNQPTEEIMNTSADANDDRETSMDDWSQRDIDQQVESDARDLEKQYFDEWAATHDDNGNSSADIEHPDDKTNQNSNPDNHRSPGDNADKAYGGSVMVEYDLKNRDDHSLPRPGYTCNSSGTVVVDIKVDKSGNVKAATYNSGMSTSADECMINKAIRYAKKSRFNFSNSAPGSQSGTITYKFVSK